jgi:hypothetical protein
MSINQTLEILKQQAPLTEKQAASILAEHTLAEQKKIIAAFVIGRDHIHRNAWNENELISVKCIAHIPHEDYARKLFEVNVNLVAYLESFERCAKNAKFDLDSL